MADHPLRPATDRRLGRPLPHQLPNRTQAAPKAHLCFGPQPICGISPSFPGLSPTSGHVPTRYSPVRHSPCGACDLHVLSMPPAFTLSQDQTLRFIHQPQHHPYQAAPQSAPEPPNSSLSHQASPAIPDRPPDTKPPHPGTRSTPPLSRTTQHPSADHASHPSPKAPRNTHTSRHHQATPDKLRPRNPSAQHPAIQSKGQPRHQTLPKPIHLSKNNARSARDNLR